jgi:hypothetical protein
LSSAPESSAVDPLSSDATTIMMKVCSVDAEHDQQDTALLRL